MKIKLIAMMLVTLIWSSAPAKGAGTRQVITAQNASRLQELYLLGQGTVNDITWSPDGSAFVVSTTRGVWLYDGQNVNLPPVRLDAHSTAEVAFSTDSSLLAAYTTYSPISIWNIKTRTLVRRVTIPDQNEDSERNHVLNVAFKPSGKLLMTLGYQGPEGFYIRDEETNIILVDDKNTYQIEDVTISPDQKTVAIASGDLTGPDSVDVWDLTTGQHVAGMGNFQSKTNNVVFSADGSTIATANGNVPSDFAGQDDNVVALWNGKTHAKIAVMNGHTGWVTRVAFSPHGKVLASGSADGTVRLWDVQTHQLQRTLNTDRGIVTALAYSPDGSLLAVATGGGDIRFWRLADWKLQTVLDGFTGDSNPYVGPGVPDQSCCLAFSPDSSQVAFGQLNSLIQVWDTTTGKTARILHGNKDVVSSIAFSPDNKTIISTGWDATSRLWDVKAAITTLDFKHDAAENAPGYGANFSPNGQYVSFFVGYGYTNLEIYKVNPPLKLHEDSTVYGATFSPDSSLMAIIEDNSIVVWALKASKAVATLSSSNIRAMKFSSDSKALWVASYNGTIQLWDIEKQQVVKQFSIGPLADNQNDIWFDNSLTRVAVANSEEHDDSYVFHVHVWDLTTEKPVTRIDTQHYPDTAEFTDMVEFSPNDQVLALGGRDYGVEVWNPATGRQLAWLHYPDNESQYFQFQYVEFSPDGTLIGIVGGDDAVTLYGVPN